jgi:hypothetical protein
VLDDQPLGPVGRPIARSVVLGAAAVIRESVDVQKLEGDCECHRKSRSLRRDQRRGTKARVTLERYEEVLTWTLPAAGNRGNFTYNPVYGTPKKTADFCEEFGESFSNIG